MKQRLISIATLFFIGFASVPVAPARAAVPPSLSVRITASSAVSPAVRGQTNAKMLAFDLTSRGGDTDIDKINFNIFGDNDANFATIESDVNIADRLLDCSLFQTSGSPHLVSGPEPVTADGVLTFNDTFVVPSDVKTSFVVRCNFSTEAVSGGDRDRLAVWISGASAIEAYNGSLLDATGLMIGTTTSDTLNADGGVSILLAEHGDLLLALGATTPPPATISEGTSGVSVGKWSATAVSEDSDIQKLTFDTVLTGSGNVPFSTATLYCNTFPMQTVAPSSSGRLVFTASCNTPRGFTNIIEVKVDVDSFISSKATSGDTFALVLNARDADTFETMQGWSGDVLTESYAAKYLPASLMTLL